MNATKFYWEKRSPVNPQSNKKFLQTFIEDGFVHDFHSMYSKNNHDRHPLKREYFDSPVNYVHRGFQFSPRHKLPLEFFDNGKSHYNVRDPDKKPAYRRNLSHTMYKVGEMIPRINSVRGLAADVTTGVPSHMMY